MTNEEAIKRMDYEKTNCNNSMDCDMECEQCIDAKYMAIEALSKQIPQYVDDTRTNAAEIGQVGYDFCPKCGALVTGQFCEKCGQALKYYQYELYEDENGHQFYKRSEDNA